MKWTILSNIVSDKSLSYNENGGVTGWWISAAQFNDATIEINKIDWPVYRCIS